MTSSSDKAKHVRLYKLALLFPLVALTGCPPTPKPADPKTIDTAIEKYNARQVEESEALADQYITTNPTGDRLDEAYYLRGLSRLTRGSRPLAAMDLKQALDKTQRTDLKGKAFRALGDIDMENQSWPAAQANYEAALATGTLAATSVTALNYRIGVCQQAIGQWGRAQAWFDKVIAANNDDALKERAVARRTASHFALQFGAFQSSAGARDLVAELQKNNITAAIESELREGQFLYLVRSGSYNTWGEAATIRDRLLSKYPLVIIFP